jgi:hypothetical protein
LDPYPEHLKNGNPDPAKSIDPLKFQSSTGNASINIHYYYHIMIINFIARIVSRHIFERIQFNSELKSFTIKYFGLDSVNRRSLQDKGIN